MTLPRLLAIFPAALLLAGCAARHVAAPTIREAEATLARQFASSGCPDDPAAYLKKHVWSPSRLEIIEPCITVTGVLTDVRPILDGDLHIRLRLDPPYEGLLNDANRRRQAGQLVIEPACRWAPWRRNSTGPCKNRGYSMHIPKTGTRVRVTGTFVFDRDHAWNELHPIFKMDILP